MDRRRFVLTALLVASAPPVFAQAAPPVRVRGSIAALKGNTLTVKTRDGQTMDIALTDPLVVMTVQRADFSAIGPGTYIGTTTRTGADGKMTAIEVRIFPESMRGAGEGHRDWDLEPGSKMTNGTVTGAVTSYSGGEIIVGHKDGTHTVAVTRTTGVMLFVPGERGDLKIGEVVVVTAAKAPDGTMTSGRVAVGKDGVVPMM